MTMIYEWEFTWMGSQQIAKANTTTTIIRVTRFFPLLSNQTQPGAKKKDKLVYFYPFYEKFINSVACFFVMIHAN